MSHQDPDPSALTPATGTAPDLATAFEMERPRLIGLATRVLGDRTEAEDIVQHTWLRLQGQSETPLSIPAWCTTVTTRLCLDRLRAKKPELVGDDTDWDTVGGAWPADQPPQDSDLADDLALAETVGVALQVVLDQLGPTERVAFVLHDSFGFSFDTIAQILDSSPAATRKLASRARAKVRQSTPQDALADWEVVDAFLAAARGGEFARLMDLLAPDVRVRADRAAITLGTPERMDGRESVATFFNGAAKTARPVSVDGRPGAAWVQRGEVKVLFDFTVDDGSVTAITFRADPDVLASVQRREGPALRR